MKQYWKLIPLFLLAFGCMANRFSAPPSNQDEIEAIYVKRCAGCHSFDGHSPRPNMPDFSDPKFHGEHTDDQLIESITNGKPPRMPSYASIMDKDEIVGMVAYIRTLNKTDKDKKDSPSSKESDKESAKEPTKDNK